MPRLSFLDSFDPLHPMCYYQDIASVPENYHPELFKDISIEFLLFLKYKKLNFDFEYFFHSIPVVSLLKKISTLEEDFADELSSHPQLLTSDVFDNISFNWNWKLLSSTLSPSDLLSFMDDPFIADKIDYEALELNPNITRLSYVEFKRHFDEKKENEKIVIEEDCGKFAVLKSREQKKDFFYRNSFLDLQFPL
jgi:hypothetical protein